MHLFDKIYPTDLDRRELHLILLACCTILILGTGLALLMYPIVFSHASSSGNLVVRNAFYGFCGLSVLLAVYLVDREFTILRLRRQIAEDRRLAVERSIEASAELLSAIPNIASFKDRLAMEYRRAAASGQVLAVLVITMRLPQDVASTPLAISHLSDAAKAISRKLRAQDSLYILRPYCFGTILPGVSPDAADRIAERIADALSDAAGVSNRFCYKMNVVNCLPGKWSAHEFQDAVLTLLPEDRSMQFTSETF